MKTKLFLSVSIILLSILFAPGNASARCRGHKSVCMTDDFGFQWQIFYCKGYATGVDHVFGYVDLGTGGDPWGFSGEYNKTTYTLSVTAYNPIPDQCATAADSFHYDGNRTGPNYSGTWYNTCGGSGTWTASSYAGDCPFHSRPVGVQVKNNPSHLGGEAEKFALPEGSDGNAMDAYLNNDFELTSPSPNPFSSTTTIGYQLETDATVSVEIYNSIGQLVTTLFNGDQEAAEYNFNWNGTDQSGRALASGSYICRVVVNGDSQSEMITIMK